MPPSEPTATINPAYHVRDDDDEAWGSMLLGPDGWECQLGEPEDSNWCRDGRDAVDRLNAQHERIVALESIARDLLDSAKASYALFSPEQRAADRLMDPDAAREQFAQWQARIDGKARP